MTCQDFFENTDHPAITKKCTGYLRNFQTPVSEQKTNCFQKRVILIRIEQRIYWRFGYCR